MQVNKVFLAWSCIALCCMISVQSSYSAHDNTMGIVENIQPSVVSILTYNTDGKPVHEACGFFIGSKNHVITTLSVIQGAGKAEIKTSERKIHWYHFPT